MHFILYSPPIITLKLLQPHSFYWRKQNTLMKKQQFTVFVLLATALIACRTSKAPVYLVPTIHGMHKTNANYNYDSLQALVKNLKPDLVLVEIRPEDIAADTTYLAMNYPYEMRMMKHWFPNLTVAGFDWLGNDIENKPIPANYWKEISPIKQYEKALAADSLFSAKVAPCDTFTNQRLEILKTSSLRQILNSNDAVLTEGYYACLSEKLAGSIHQRVTAFYDLRNNKMLERIKAIIAANPKKKIVILTGDDHFPFLKERLKPGKLF